MRSTDHPMDDYEVWAGFDRRPEPEDPGDAADRAWDSRDSDPEPKKESSHERL